MQKYLKRIKIKRLDLQSWQKLVWNKKQQEDCGIENLDGICSGLFEIKPIIYKPGWYCQQKLVGCLPFSWFENGGEAYSSKNLYTSFEYSLKIENHKPLSEKTRSALIELRNEHLLSKCQREILQTDKEWLELREIKRSSYKIFKDYKEFLKNEK